VNSTNLDSTLQQEIYHDVLEEIGAAINFIMLYTFLVEKQLFQVGHQLEQPMTLPFCIWRTVSLNVNDEMCFVKRQNQYIIVMVLDILVDIS
jgi:hypothetical protein